MSSQLYESNAGLKFPLSESHTEAVPNDLLLDMSLSVPEDVEPALSDIVCTGLTLFVAVEDRATGLAVGQFMVSRPKACAFYDMTSTMDGCRGWLVPGPGVSRVFNQGLSAPVEPDPSVVARVPWDRSSIRGFAINGVARVVDGPVRIRSGDGSLSVTTYDRSVRLPWESESANRRLIVINPAGVRGRARAVTPDGTYVNPVRTIAGVPPDEDGNVQISGDGADVEVFTLEESGTPLGVGLNCGYEASGEVSPVLRHIEHGRCGESVVIRPEGPGSATRLPLDDMLERLNPNYAKPDCGCAKP